jgi:hypothetical protein
VQDRNKIAKRQNYYITFFFFVVDNKRQRGGELAVGSFKERRTRRDGKGSLVF